MVPRILTTRNWAFLVTYFYKTLIAFQVLYRLSAKGTVFTLGLSFRITFHIAALPLCRPCYILHPYTRLSIMSAT